MIFTYRSSRDRERVIPPDVVKQVRKHLVKHMDWSCGASLGELNDCLLAFRQDNGERLMIHQLEPFFVYIATSASLWPEVED